MQRTCLDIASISRYLNSLAEIEDVLRIERHVERCARCRDKLIRMKRYSEALFDDLVTHDAGDGCPSHIQLEHFRRGSLTERQMVRVQEHLLACACCRAHVGDPTLHDSAASAASRALFAARRPDLDLRVAPQGIRIAAGASLLDNSTLPTLLLRLGLAALAPREPAITTTRQLCFARRIGVNVLRGRIELAGYEDFHLELQPSSDAALHALQLWTREGSIRRFAADRRFRELLGPGHYFVGPSLFEPPWLAVSVEQDFLTARGLAECGYDACRRGHFHSALRWLEDAVQLAPDLRAYRRLLALVDAFARRFGLEDRDRPIRWRDESFAPNTPAPRDELDATGPPTSVEAVARLVLALRNGVEDRDEGSPFAEARWLSRREFRTAFVELLQQIEVQLGPTHCPCGGSGASR